MVRRLYGSFSYAGARVCGIGDRMGTESVFTTYKGGQVMYHVSTLLPFNPRHQQQLERKCHLGNDIVMIVYQDGKVEFSPEEIASQFNSTRATFFATVMTMTWGCLLIHCLDALDH
mgnify:FL=1